MRKLLFVIPCLLAGCANQEPSPYPPHVQEYLEETDFFEESGLQFYPEGPNGYPYRGPDGMVQWTKPER